jgi:hypothetical protein
MEEYKDKKALPMQPPTEELSTAVGEAEADDDLAFAEMAPSGKYSAQNLNLLVAATNKLLPIFEQSPDYPTFEGPIDGVLPTDFVRVLVMFLGAVDSAIAADAIDDEMAYDLQELVDDASLLQLSGRLTALAANRDFRQFLKNPPEEEDDTEETLPISDEEALMSNEDIDKLFTARA